jgi:hypothetical protein
MESSSTLHKIPAVDATTITAITGVSYVDRPVCSMAAKKRTKTEQAIKSHYLIKGRGQRMTLLLLKN